MPRPGRASVARAFLVRGFFEASRNRLGVILNVVWLACALLTFRYFSRFLAGSTAGRLSGYFGFVVIGYALLDFFQGTLMVFGRRIREAQMVGSLDGLLATPTPELWVAVSLPAWDLCTVLLRGTICLAVAGLWLDAPFQVHGVSLVLTLVLMLLAFVPFGLLSAALTMLLRRGDPLALAVGMASSVFSGVFYPPESLPPWGRAVAQFLPLTHALEASRGALLHALPPGALLRPLGMLCVTGAVVLPLGVLAFTAALRRARVEGSLSRY